jgi:hypothetical protein
MKKAPGSALRVGVVLLGVAAVVALLWFGVPWLLSVALAGFSAVAGGASQALGVAGLDAPPAAAVWFFVFAFLCLWLARGRK